MQEHLILPKEGMFCVTEPLLLDPLSYKTTLVVWK